MRFTGRTAAGTCNGAEELLVKIESEAWHSGEGLEEGLKKGIGLDILFLDIELFQKNGIEERR